MGSDLSLSMQLKRGESHHAYMTMEEKNNHDSYDTKG